MSQRVWDADFGDDSDSDWPSAWAVSQTSTPPDGCMTTRAVEASAGVLRLHWVDELTIGAETMSAIASLLDVATAWRATLLFSITAAIADENLHALLGIGQFIADVGVQDDAYFVTVTAPSTAWDDGTVASPLGTGDHYLEFRHDADGTTEARIWEVGDPRPGSPIAALSEVATPVSEMVSLALSDDLSAGVVSPGDAEVVFKSLHVEYGAAGTSSSRMWFYEGFG